MFIFSFMIKFNLKNKIVFQYALKLLEITGIILISLKNVQYFKEKFQRVKSYRRNLNLK